MTVFCNITFMKMVFPLDKGGLDVVPLTITGDFFTSFTQK